MKRMYPPSQMEIYFEPDNGKYDFSLKFNREYFVNLKFEKISVLRYLIKKKNTKKTRYVIL